MQNENYYKAQLEAKINEFFDEESDEGGTDWGWVGNNAPKLMADAAFNILAASKDVQDYLVDNGELKP